MTLGNGNASESVIRSHRRREYPLRSRIMLATTTTAVLAVLAVGIFAFIRNEATQALLGNRFQESVKEKSESEILALVSIEAQSINKFFVEVDQTVTSTTAFTKSLLNQSATFESGIYWDATQRLFRLPSGAWDNINNEPVSIFAPANIEIDEQLRRELNAIVQLDLTVPDALQANPDIVAIYYISKNDITAYYPNIDLANLIPSDFKATEQPFYTGAKAINKNNTVWTLPYQDPALTGLIVTNSGPVYDQNNNFRGVVGADLLLAKINERVEAIEIGKTGYAFLIDSAGRIITMPDSGYQALDLTPEQIPVNESPQLTLLDQAPTELRLVYQSMAQGGNGLARVQFHDTEYFLAYAPISSPKYSLGITVPVSELETAVREAQALVEKENQQTQSYGLVLLIIVVILAALISFIVSQVLTNPLSQLTSTAVKVSAGDLTAKASETTVKEVNVLANAFNSMTSQLSSMLAGLEERVAERTTELEDANRQSKRRAAQFEAIAQVAHEISSSQDLETLLPKITNLISQQFNFYHVGVFLLDRNKEYAVLRAANSPGGQKMLAREHRLKVGEVGLVGFATNRGKARIALDTGADAVYFDNPDLPDTRSEMALPMIVGGQIIGALDVQSTQSDAFSRDDIETLSTLADQVGIAIQNARIYQEMDNALTQSRVLSQQITSIGWHNFTHQEKLAGIRRNKAKSTLLKEVLSTNETNAENSLNLPITLRGQVIGKLKVQTSKNRQWTQDEIDIASAIIERAAIAMESARLLNDAQRRATRERIIGEISSSVSSSTDMEEILRNAVQELGSRMGGAEVVLELGTDLETEDKTE